MPAVIENLSGVKSLMAIAAPSGTELSSPRSISHISVLRTRSVAITPAV
jgi:hypothetical protein